MWRCSIYLSDVYKLSNGHMVSCVTAHIRKLFESYSIFYCSDERHLFAFIYTVKTQIELPADLFEYKNCWLNSFCAYVKCIKKCRVSSNSEIVKLGNVLKVVGCWLCIVSLVKCIDGVPMNFRSKYTLQEVSDFT